VLDETPPLVTALQESGTTVQLLLAWRAENAPAFPPTYRIERVDIADAVGPQLLGYALTAAETVDHGTQLAYDPEYTLRSSQYFTLERKDWPGGNLFERLGDFLNLDRFDRKRLTKPRLYTVAVQTSNGNAFFGNGMSALQVLGQKRGAFNLVWDGSTFNAFTDSVATFSSSFDWVAWQDRLYILNLAGFHMEFRDAAELRQAVRDHVNQITRGRLKIQNADALVARCEANVAMAAKLRRIADHGIQEYDIDALKQYAEDYALDLEWIGDAVVFKDTFARQWDVLILLDEDRTEGPVSHRKYESSSKRVLPTVP
jgi:Kiwa protein KwaB-like